MSENEQRLINWLSMEDFAAFGECHGPVLDQLVMHGLATIIPANASAGYAIVKLTEKGREQVDQKAVQEELNRRWPKRS